MHHELMTQCDLFFSVPFFITKGHAKSAFRDAPLVQSYSSPYHPPIHPFSSPLPSPSPTLFLLVWLPPSWLGGGSCPFLISKLKQLPKHFAILIVDNGCHFKLPLQCLYLLLEGLRQSSHLQPLFHLLEKLNQAATFKSFHVIQISRYLNPNKLA